jgi:hypothetical protein
MGDKAWFAIEVALAAAITLAVSLKWHIPLFGGRYGLHSEASWIFLGILILSEVIRLGIKGQLRKRK